MAATWRPPRCGCSRNAEGAYGANVNHLVENGGWDDEDELAETYRAPQVLRLWPQRPAGAADGADEARPRRPSSSPTRTSTSVELGVTTVDHYFDTLGGISRAVKRASGTAVPVYIGDQTRGEGVVRTLAEQVALETRTRTLNPKWYEGMLAPRLRGRAPDRGACHQHHGLVGDHRRRSRPGSTSSITETFVLDPAMRERLAALNPAASAKSRTA